MAALRRLLFFLLLLPFADSSQFRSVFVREGGEAALTCPNAEPGQSQCSKTTWVFSPANGLQTVELIGLGQIGSRVSEISGLSERLTLTEQCGLKIQRVRPQEAGVFWCKQYEREGGAVISKSGVDLSVVSLTEKEEQQSVQLRCAVSSFTRPSVRWIIKDRVVDKDNPDVQQISQKEVVFTLTGHFLLQEKHLLKCEVTDGDTTEEFSFSPDQTNTNQTPPPDTEDRKESGVKDWHWAAGALVLVVLVVLVVVLIVWRRLRAKPQGPSTAPQVTPTAPQVTPTAPQVTPTAPQTEPDDGVSYATVTYNRNQRPEVRGSEEAVTYSSVRIKASENALYATVNKPKPVN